MAYTTHLTDVITVTSKDIRLSRGRVEREHTVHGVAGRVVVYENRTTQACTLYQGANEVGTYSTLSKAYAAAVTL